MPFNKIHVPRDLPTSKCHAINDALHDSLVEMCRFHPEDYFCLICRYAPDDMILHPTYLGRRNSAATIIVEVTLLGGRTDEQKEAFHADFRRRLHAIGHPPDDCIIFLVENRPIDWSFSTAGSVKTVLGL